MKNNEHLCIVSEKIFPDKITNVIWNSKVDIIAVISGLYYEIQRVGFKHEVIMKKEEKSPIEKIIFSNIDNIIIVILQDSTVYYINIGNGNTFLILF